MTAKCNVWSLIIHHRFKVQIDDRQTDIDIIIHSYMTIIGTI